MHAGFDEAPVSLTVPIGSLAVFRCRYSNASSITWRVNGTVVKVNASADVTQDVRDEAGNMVDILSIAGLTWYNGTTAECVAHFASGEPDELTEPVMLILQGEWPKKLACGRLTRSLNLNYYRRNFC